jgi:hypothetical protein
MVDLSELTAEEKAVIINGLIMLGLQTNHKSMKDKVNTVLTKLGLMDAAVDTFAHYKKRAEGRE